MTLINETYRFVFVHVPKNAGTSVAHYLSQLSTYRDIEIGATAMGEAMAPEYRQRFGLHKHSTLAEIAEVMGADVLADFRTLAVIRDPAYRVRSIYTFLRRWPGWTSLDPAYERFRSEFSGFDGVDAFVASDLFLMPGPDRMFMPQVSWLSLDDEASVAADHVIRFEHLEGDLQRVVTELGLPLDRLPGRLRRANTSRDGRRQAHPRQLDRVRARLAETLSRPDAERAKPLLPHSLDRIRERYAPDYELLGPWD
jgi:hypothetical protein